MSLFDKKTCDVCGGKIGLLGNRKLEDGNLCKSCASQLSPWFSGRRHATLADVKNQLQDREANKARAAAFRKGEKLGFDSCSLYLDEAGQSFAVCYESDWNKGNPDILPVSCVTEAKSDVEETRTERKYKNDAGNMVSYNPPVFDYSYDYHIVLTLDHPYIGEIRFRLNSTTLKRGGGGIFLDGDKKIAECESLCERIVDFFKSAGKRASSASAQASLTVDIPTTQLLYRMHDEQTSYDLTIRLDFKGMVSCKIVNQPLYEAALGSPALLPDHFLMVIRRIFLAFEDRGEQPDAITPERIREAFMQAVVPSFIDQYGLQVTDAFLFQNIHEEDMKTLIDLSKLRAQQALLASQNRADADWVCPACGSVNHGGRFCSSCGTAKP